MKKVILFMIVIIWSQILFCVSVKMDDGLIYEGSLTSKLKGDIYLLDGYMLYELPIKDISIIVNNGINITEVTLNKTDFSKISIEDNKFFIYKHGSMENLKGDYIDSREVMLNMSDREFAIYELGLKQKQAEMVSKKINRVSNTMWTIWGISVGISGITILALNL